MADLRLQKLAHVLINYSLEIKPGDKLLIRSLDTAAPLVREIYREAILAGAHPTARIRIDGLAEIKLREGTDEQICYLSEIDVAEMEQCDALLSIWAENNTKSLSGIAPDRLALAQQATGRLTQIMMERSARGDLRWCGTLFPTNAHAQDAWMSLSDYEQFVYGAGHLDRDDPAEAWRQVRDTQQRIADFLEQHDEIHIVAPGTDLTYRVAGRSWINACGLRNFPDGEVFSAPIEDSVNGTVQFTYPAVYNANEVEGVRLVFENGRVVQATAQRGQEFLESMLDMDEGARSVGEVAFGLNYSIQKFTRNILFDEKIGGTMHMALGRAYPETGGKNASALHWDMICDLREGKVFADGQQCYEHGRFTI